MHLASKIEEILSPRVADFVKSTDGAYTGGQIAEMEIKLIKKLNWKLYFQLSMGGVLGFGLSWAAFHFGL